MNEDGPFYCLSEENEFYDGKVVGAIIDGQNPVSAFREYRRMSILELAEKIGEPESFVVQVEAGEFVSRKIVEKISKALEVDADILNLNY